MGFAAQVKSKQSEGDWGGGEGGPPSYPDLTLRRTKYILCSQPRTDYILVLQIHGGGKGWGG